MLTLNDFNNPANNSYLDTCIINSMSYLNTMKYDDIISLDVISKRYNADILSNISMNNFYLKMITNNIANIQMENYILSLAENIKDLRNLSLVTINLNEFQIITNDVIASLESIKVKLEESYGVELSIYNTDNTENGLNYSIEKPKNPLVFNYYNSKVSFKKMLIIIEKFSTNKIESDDKNQSMELSFVDKLYSILDSAIIDLQSKTNLSEGLEEITDSCMITKKIYAEYSFTSTADVTLFLTREYNKVKTDIINSVINQW